MKNNPPEFWHSAKKGYKYHLKFNHRMNGLRKAFYEAKAKADAAELLKILENDNVDYLAAEAKAASYIDYLDENDYDVNELLGIGEPGNQINEGNDGVPVSGLNLIKEFEGFRKQAYVDPLSGGLPITIGWGSTKDKNGNNFKLGDEITKQDAAELLLNQCKKNYLPSITAVLKNKEWDEVPAKFLLYVNRGSNVEAGLRKRRTAEGLAWTKGTYS